jgi:hypothetical protein
VSVESTAVGSEVGVTSLELGIVSRELSVARPDLKIQSVGLELSAIGTRLSTLSPSLSMVNAWKGWEKVESWIWTGSEYGYDDWDHGIMDEAVL